LAGGQLPARDAPSRGGADADAYWGGRNAKVLIEVPVGMEINKYARAARK